MRFNVDRICELAGLGAAAGGLISEAAAGPAPSAKPAAPAAPAAKAPVAKKPVAAEMYHSEADDESIDMNEYGEMDMHNEMDMDMGMDMGMYGDEFMDDEMYEIDETELMEALVSMRQQRLEESSIRDAVRDEIKRALTDRSGSWVYGANKPSVSGFGRIARGGLGYGFKK